MSDPHSSDQLLVCTEASQAQANLGIYATAKASMHLDVDCAA
jgi:hypothetical protein